MRAVDAGRLCLLVGAVWPIAGAAGSHATDQDFVTVDPLAMNEGIRSARWPARLQLLGAGRLTALVSGREVWLDGGHNPDAGAAIGRHFAGPLHLVIGMLANKNPRAIVEPRGDRIASLSAVPIAGSDCHVAQAFGPGSHRFRSVEEALAAIPADALPILIAGSL